VRGRGSEIALRLRDGAVPIAAIIGLLSLLLFIRVPGRGAWLRATLNASHAPIFAAVAVLLAILLRSGSRREPSSWPDWRSYGLAFVLAVGIGALIEFLQSLSDRPPSLFDLGTDAAGAVIGLALLAFFERRRLPEPKPTPDAAAWILMALAIGGVLFVAWHPVQAARAYLARLQTFPVLASYGDSVGLPMVNAVHATVAIEALPSPWQRQPGEKALRVRYGQGASDNAWPIRYLGIEPSPDWGGHSTLALELVNPGPAALPVTLRILDAGHHWELDPPPSLPIAIPGATRATFRFELGTIATRDGRRPLDLQRIEEIFLIPAEPQVPVDLFVARIWLEP